MGASSRILKPGVSIDAKALMSMHFEEGRAIIPGFLYLGLTILASRPKDGKSFLALKLGLCLATGSSFLGMPPTRCGVLVMALEDTLDRLQDRLNLLPYEKTGSLRFMTTSKGLPDDVFRELDLQLSEFPDIRLVVIDTLQKVRHRSGDVSYGADYEDLGALKEYADQRGIAILLLHHTRKADAGSAYDKISGTSGITGVADTMMVLERHGGGATLSVRGREAEEREFQLEFRGGDWELADPAAVEARSEAALPEGVRLVESFMGSRESWSGTFKELLAALGSPGMTERRLSQQLRDNRETLAARGISLASRRTNRGSVLSLAHTALQ
jgi:hypothetical protein